VQIMKNHELLTMEMKPMTTVNIMCMNYIAFVTKTAKSLLEINSFKSLAQVFFSMTEGETGQDC
jgi:hypothetical protein